MAHSDKLPAIKKIFESIARQERILPSEVTRVQFRDVARGKISQWTIEQLGGLNAVKEKLFGADVAPVHELCTKEFKTLDLKEQLEIIAHHIQLAADSLRVNPDEVVWPQFQTYIRRGWGRDNMNAANCAITLAGGFYAIRDMYFPPQPRETTITKNRLREHAAVNRRLGTDTVKQQFLLNRIEEFADRVFKGRITPLRRSTRTDTTDRILNVMLSDLHFGSDINAVETGRHPYGRIEEARSLAYIVKQVCEYKQQYRSHTRLKVILGGDILQNLLHSQQDGAVLSEQVARSIHLLIQAIGHFAVNFPIVDVIGLTGNHGRITSKHPKRAIHDKSDSIETMIYYAVKSACRHLENVNFIIPQSAYTSYDVFGTKIFATHGDTVFSVGDPSSTIWVNRLESQINRINAAMPSGEGYKVFVVGHIHMGTILNLGNGTVLITNGPLCPPDAFTVSIGIFESARGQMLWESVKGFPVGDARFIKLDSTTDKDTSLDSIIEPWSEF